MTKTTKDPLVKISKRQNLALQYKLLLTVGAILLSLVLGGILLACLGYNPIEFYTQMLMGNFKNASYLKLMVRALIPLLITSLGVSLAFKMRFWNIGAEGQFIVGAIIAMTFSLLIGDSLPSPLGAIIVVLLGTLGGGLYALFVAVLKVKFNTNETLMTLMLNYVALYIASYMLKTDFFAIQGQGVPSFKVIAQSLWLTEINLGKFSFDTAVFIAVALVIILFVYFKQSKQGYELNVVGDSPNTAKYAGMKVKWIIVRTMFLSGAIIGMAGALKLCGSSAGHTFSANITGGVGWTSIIVAWLAKLNPIGIFIASLLMSILERGCAFARSSLGISESMSDVLQGIILFTVLASDFFINYKLAFRKKRKAQPEAVTEAASDDQTQDAQASDAIAETGGATEAASQEVVAEKTQETASESAEDVKETSDEKDVVADEAQQAPQDIGSASEEQKQTEAEETPVVAPEADKIPSDTAADAKDESASAEETGKTEDKKEEPEKTVKKPAAKKTAAKKPTAKSAGTKTPGTSTEKTASDVKKTSDAKKSAKKTPAASEKKPAAKKTTVKKTATTSADGVKKTATKKTVKNGKGGGNNE